MDAQQNKLSLYDSLAREKRAFEPLQPGHVGIYVCGPTVYGDAHLGHAKSYVSFDVLVRWLRHLGFRVRYVQNITDVGHLTDDADEGEDKLEKQARLDKVHPMEVAERFTRSYMKDMEALKVGHADIYPRASQHIPEQIEIIEDLIARGHAYEAGGNVYFSVASWPDYGQLSGRQTGEGRAGTRVSTRTDKRDPRDFALWKQAEPGHVLRWKSPWGDGYPGWHIECSAMSTKYLGEAFDIHGGGIENKFPHHECEIAQSRAHGHAFARFWLHNNMINVDGQKMGKSLKNFVTVRDALDRHSPEAIRFFLLSTHYRSPANYTDEALRGGAGGVERLATCAVALASRAAAAPAEGQAADAALEEATTTARASFQAAMDDDLNTPGAIAALFDFTRAANAALKSGEPLSRPVLATAGAVFSDLAEGVLGLMPATQAAASADADASIDLLLRVRAALKERKAFDLADTVRDGLADLGIEIRDGKAGATWSRRQA